ncbi:peptidyl-prolyl cis-trans isomerase FKBP62-like protein [Tanacetum coccineum]|uniref:peptidylprolyl isomerase n=1 Tax=Tanacetum coccineum TaxID=301880 RepID=A0ABQ4YRV5_9ASTR
MKTILTEGEGWQTPKDPDEVLGALFVHYMSLHYPDYAVKYEAQLEDGSLVTKFGEVKFIGKDDAFAENDRELASGNECVVPSNATIQITLGLVSWKIVYEVTTDNKVSKKILNEGEGYERLNDGAVFQVKLIRKHQDGTIFVNKEDNEVPFKFKIDEEQVINGLDRGVKTMKKGQVAILTIHPKYVFGSTESHQESATVPTNSIVYYDLELDSFMKEKDSWELTTPAKIKTCGRKKEEWNTIFKKQKYERASKRYEKVIKCWYNTTLFVILKALGESWLLPQSRHAKRALDLIHATLPIILGQNSLELWSLAYIGDAKCYLSDSAISGISDSLQFILYESEVPHPLPTVSELPSHGKLSQPYASITSTSS